jgi:hypothetical protein
VHPEEKANSGERGEAEARSKKRQGSPHNHGPGTPQGVTARAWSFAVS